MPNKSQFQNKGPKFSNVEQAMMFGKAVLFDDYTTANLILVETSPAKMREHGRKISGYNDDVWDKVRYQYVRILVYEKFRQNEDLCQFLLNTGDAILVEAAHYDKVWGIGIHIAHPDVMNPDKWKGTNLLGQCLMDVRKKLT